MRGHAFSRGGERVLRARGGGELQSREVNKQRAKQLLIGGRWRVAVNEA